MQIVAQFKIPAWVQSRVQTVHACSVFLFVVSACRSCGLQWVSEGCVQGESLSCGAYLTFVVSDYGPPPASALRGHGLCCCVRAHAPEAQTQHLNILRSKFVPVRETR